MAQQREAIAFKNNQQLPAAQSTYQYTVDELREFVKCKEDPIYFIRNYMKIIDVDKGLVPFEMYPFQERMVNNYHNNRFNITMCSRQVGKAAHIDTPILTSCGWKKIVDVHPGDFVYTPEGTLTQVIAESPIFYNHDVYRVRFDTDDVIDVDAEHLWTVEVLRKRQIGHGKKDRKLVSAYETITLTTRELLVELQKKHRIRIRTTQPLQFPQKQQTGLLLDPYMFGLWLGDGESASPYMVGTKEDVDFYQTQTIQTFVDLHNNRPHLRKIKFSTTSVLKQLNVYKNKHIPEVYLYSTIENRLALLQGLMDTDGNSNGRGGCQFYQRADRPLLKDVRTLLWGLGIKHRYKIKNVNGVQYATLQFSTELPVFRLPRKLELHNNRKKSGNQNIDRKIHEKSKYWYIHDIEKIESVPVKCISVDHPTHLFLCGNQLIPTHNSTTVVAYFLYYILFNVNVNVCISANKQKTAVDLLGRLKLAYENLPRFLQQGIRRWARLEIELANGSRAFAAATSSSAVRGGSYNCIGGNSDITVKVDDDIFVLPIETWYQIIANSSKDTKFINTNKDVFLEDIDYDIFRQQVYSLVYGPDGEKKNKSSNIDRKIYNESPSYYSKVHGGRPERRYCGVNDTGTSISTSDFASYDIRDKNKTIASIRIYEDAFGASGPNDENDRPTKNHMRGSTVRVATTTSFGEKTFRRNKGENWKGSFGKNCICAIPKKDERKCDGSRKRNSAQPGILQGSIGWIEGAQENRRVGQQNQSQSRKNCKNSSKAQRNETYTRATGKDGKKKGMFRMEQGINNDPRTTSKDGKKEKDRSSDISVLTNRGFKQFDGIRRTWSKNIIRLILENGQSIQCTPDHEIYVNDITKIPAKDLLGELVKTKTGYSRVINIQSDIPQYVYDMLHVEDTHNFFANNILVSNCLLLDEFAFVPDNIANEFYASTFPTITSGKETKIIMVSTPNGMNLFHKFWSDAERGHNDFKPLFVHWSEVPNRDEKWKQDTIRNIGGPEKFAQEYECISGDTEIIVKDAITGNIMLMHIDTLYEQLI